MEDTRFVIIKGLIDGKDDKQAAFHGAFLGVASPFEVRYLKAVFSPIAIDRDLQWAQLLSLFDALQPPSDSAELLHFAARVETFISENKLLQAAAKSMNNKPIEQKVSHFCSEELRLRSVTFVDITAATEADLQSFAHIEEEKSESPKPESEPIASAPDDDAEPEPEEKSRALFVACEPILDPVSGVPIGDLAVGDSVACRLPLDSIYFKLFVSRFPDFDGSVTGEVTGIKINELGTAIVGIDLADGIAGVIKLSGKVRIRLADKEGYAKKRRDIRLRLGTKNDFLFGLILGSMGVFVLLCLIGVLLFYLS